MTEPTGTGPDAADGGTATPGATAAELAAILHRVQSALADARLARDRAEQEAERLDRELVEAEERSRRELEQLRATHERTASRLAAIEGSRGWRAVSAVRRIADRLRP